MVKSFVAAGLAAWLALATAFAAENVAGNPPEMPMSGIKFEMGPKRPYPPREEVQVVIRAAVADVLGKDAKVHVSSGSNIDHVHHKGPDKPSHGSRRHGTGYAADVSFYDSAGRKVTDKATIEAIMVAAARHGAKGFGWGGPEYMGWDCVHIDLLEPQGRESHFWEQGGRRISGKLTEAMGWAAKNGIDAKSRKF